ncbi:flavodoxin family protein [Thiovibrio sp. JS02]
MPTILAINGSPRLAGNTDLLLARAVEGARSAGCQVTGLELRSLHISPCLELYGCKNNGRCVIKDDFQQFYDLIPAAQAIMLASPIFFYTVSGQTKIFMDRCQSFWVKKTLAGQHSPRRKQLQQKRTFPLGRRQPGQTAFRGGKPLGQVFFRCH